MADNEYERHLFIVRIWRGKPAAGQVAQWRGSIEQQGEPRYYFASANELADFITLRLQPADPESPDMPDSKFGTDLSER